jgi:hypothetical protein
LESEHDERLNELPAFVGELRQRLEELERHRRLEEIQGLPAFVGELRQRLEEIEDELPVEGIESLDTRLKQLEDSPKGGDSGCLSIVVFLIALKVFWPWLSAAARWVWDLGLVVLAALQSGAR